MSWKSVPMPERLAKRERDKRGFPIPYIVFRDAKGLPHFTVNDQYRVKEVILEQRCGLCGEKLDNGAWFVGGPMCFLHPQGAFIDPPNHEACARYALQVCPYLAAPSYGKRIDTKLMGRAVLEPGQVIHVDEAEQGGRPPLFGLGVSDRYTPVPAAVGTFYLVGQNWLHLEFWRDSRRLLREEAAPVLVEMGLLTPD